MLANTLARERAATSSRRPRTPTPTMSHDGLAHDSDHKVSTGNRLTTARAVTDARVTSGAGSGRTAPLPSGLEPGGSAPMQRHRRRGPARCRDSAQTTAEGSMSFPTIFRSVSGGSGTKQSGLSWAADGTTAHRDLSPSPSGTGGTMGKAPPNSTSWRCWPWRDRWGSATSSPSGNVATQGSRPQGGSQTVDAAAPQGNSGHIGCTSVKRLWSRAETQKSRAHDQRASESDHPTRRPK